MPLTAGARVGHYVIGGCLGVGGLPSARHDARSRHRHRRSTRPTCPTRPA